MFQETSHGWRQNCYALSFLRKLYQFQQDRYLCDVTVVSCDGQEFVAHAAVLAAAISDFREQLEECAPGYYTVETNMTGRQLLLLIHYVYTGNIVMPSTIRSYIEMGLCTNKAHEIKMQRSLNEFTTKGLFCNMSWQNEFRDMKPAQAYVMAAKYDFLAYNILNQSQVKLTLSNTIQQILRNYYLVASTK